MPNSNAASIPIPNSGQGAISDTVSLKDEVRQKLAALKSSPNQNREADAIAAGEQSLSQAANRMGAGESQNAASEQKSAQALANAAAALKGGFSKVGAAGAAAGAATWGGAKAAAGWTRDRVGAGIEGGSKLGAAGAGFVGGIAAASISSIGSDSFKVTTFLALSGAICWANATILAGNMAYMLIFIILFTLSAWWLLYDLQGLNTLLFCLIVSVLTIFQPVIAGMLKSQEVISIMLLFAPAWIMITLFLAGKRTWFINFLAVGYVILCLTLAFPTMANESAKLINSGVIPFPDSEQLASTQAKVDSIIRTAWRELLQAPTRITKAIDDKIYYAQHGYERGEVATDIKFVGVKFTDPTISNKLEYDPKTYIQLYASSNTGVTGSAVSDTRVNAGAAGTIPAQVPIEIRSREKANNKKAMTVEITCESQYLDCDTPPCKTKVPQIIASPNPPILKDKLSVNANVKCQAMMPTNEYEWGDYKIIITATVKKFQSTATLTEKYVSEEALTAKLEQYLQTHDIIGEYERDSVVASMYSLDGTPVSISDPGPVKVIITGSEQPVTGLEDCGPGKKEICTEVPVLITLQRSEYDGGELQKINSLTIELPKGMELATEKSNILSQSAKQQTEAETKNTITTDPCPMFEATTGEGQSGGKIIKLKDRFKDNTQSKIIDFTKAEQQSYESCLLKVTNPKELLLNPERANPATFKVNINYDFKVEKSYTVSWGRKKYRSTSTSTGGGDACPEISALNYPIINPSTRGAATESNVNSFNTEIQAASQKYGVCTALIKGIITTESSGDNVKNQNPNDMGALGLMQIIQIGNMRNGRPAPGAGDECKNNNAQTGISSNDDLKTAAGNINCGTWFVKQKIAAQGGNIENGLGFYNGGTKGANAATREPETQKYLPLVIGFAKYYASKEALSGGGGTFSGTKFNRLPLDGKPGIHSCFGNRIVEGKSEFHDGLDFTANTGTFVKAVGPGVVYKAADAGGFGNSVVIEHNANLFTGYNHLSEILVSVGQTVNEGDIIGKVGNTGRSFGAHLDFKAYESKSAVWGADTAINPHCVLPIIEGQTVSSITGTGCNDLTKSCNCKKLGQCS